MKTAFSFQTVIPRSLPFTKIKLPEWKTSPSELRIENPSNDISPEADGWHNFNMIPMLPFTKIAQTIQITTIAIRDSGVRSRAFMSLFQLFVN